MARGTGSADRDTTPSTAAALIPCGRKMKSYGCMRSLAKKGIHTVVASEYDGIPHFSSRFCSEAVRLPAPPTQLTVYKDALLELARRDDVETVYPVRECDVYVLAKYREEFEEVVSIVAPDLETLSRGHDRLRLAEEAEAAGVPVAGTRLLSEVEEWTQNAVIKSRYNLLTGEYVDTYPSDSVEEVKGVRFITPGDEPDAEAIRAEMKHDPVVQEFIPEADKHLYTALWDDGEPLSTYQHKQIRKNSWVGGGGVYRVSAHSQAVEENAYDLLSHLEWTGFACIEYVKDANTGEWKFLEINPRIWQSLPEAVRAGVDFPYHYWLRARGEPERIEPGYEVGTHCHNAYGEVGHLLSILRDDSPFVERPSFLRTLWDIGSSCVVHPRFDYLRLDDPKFFLSAIGETVSSGVTSSRQYDVGDGKPHPAPVDEVTNSQ